MTPRSPSITDQVDFYCPPENVERMRLTVLPNCLGEWSDAGAVHQDAGNSVQRLGCSDAFSYGGVIRDVDVEIGAANRGSLFLPNRLAHVEYRDLCPGSSQQRCGGAA
jgi:hypothetical protein